MKKEPVCTGCLCTPGEFNEDKDTIQYFIGKKCPECWARKQIKEALKFLDRHTGIFSEPDNRYQELLGDRIKKATEILQI